MKHFHCGSVVPGCTWHTSAEDEAEIVRRAVEHMRKTHGEAEVAPPLVEKIKERIKSES
jgi:predicted small metal-binding protein